MFFGVALENNMGGTETGIFWMRQFFSGSLGAKKSKFQAEGLQIKKALSAELQKNSEKNCQIKKIPVSVPTRLFSNATQQILFFYIRDKFLAGTRFIFPDGNEAG